MAEVSLFYGEVKIGPLCFCKVTVNHGIMLIGNYSPVRHSLSLSFRHNSFLFNILRMNRLNETKCCIHIISGKIYVRIVKRQFLQICNRVTALDLHQNLGFAQYLKNK